MDERADNAGATLQRRGGRWAALGRAGVALAFWAGTGVLAGAVVAAIAQQRDAQCRFVRTEGRILSSGITARRGDYITSYRPAIRYAYVVAGRRHESDRYAFGLSFDMNRAPVAAIVRSHRPGQAAAVYYDPRRPDRSVLYVGLVRQHFFEWLLVQPLAGIGLWLTAWALAPPGGRARGRGWRAVTSAGKAYALSAAACVIVLILAFRGGAGSPVWVVGIAQAACLAAGGWALARACHAVVPSGRRRAARTPAPARQREGDRSQ